ncbi:zinc finger protein 182-like [Xyrichtys novacula]|uniref:Zinc finger protein 182-like n=1 Tax=Xyrichtys novacula TaxID=13765 RepID=A0AAV1H4V5_XYRNO|nr:zinc finger protein 182-like [Xyrichtys novacula]
MLSTRKMELLKTLIGECLSAAAQEIFRIVEGVMLECEEEVSCSKWELDSQCRLMDVSMSHKEDTLQMCSTGLTVQATEQQQKPASVDAILSLHIENSTEPAEDHPDMNNICVDSSPDSENDPQSDLESQLNVRESVIKQESDMDVLLNIQKKKKVFKHPVCRSGLSSKKTIVQHFRGHPEDKSSYQCQFCSCSFLNKSEFIIHTRTHQSQGPEMYQDQRGSHLGDKQTQTEKKPIQPVSDSDIETFPLNIPPCDKNESDQESLCVYQIQTAADINEDFTAAKSYSFIKTEPNEAECGITDYTTPLLNPAKQRETEPQHLGPNKTLQRRKPSKLIGQFERGAAQKPYQCPYCSKCFSLTTTLIRHMNIHTKKKLYQCHVCGRDFCQKSDLVSHTRIHTGERPYRCPECHRSFTQKGNLVVHMRKHSGSVPIV